MDSRCAGGGRLRSSSGNARKIQRPRPIEAKESFRWLEGYRLACQVAADSPETRVVSVADREADICDIYVEAQQNAGPRADCAIRARGDRCTSDRDLAAGPAAFCKVRDEVSASQRRTTRTLELNATPHRAARTARLEVRARTVVVKPPHERSHLPAATLNAVLIEEVGGPGDGTAASWLLLASLPIETGAEILKVVD